MSTDLVLTGDLPDLFKIPAAIDWEHGRNRAHNRVSQLDAKDDLSAINEWLKKHRRSKQTLASYRKEAIRFMLWAAHERGKSISDLVHADIVAYEDFIRDPQPASKWVGKGKKLSMTHPDWRPFYGPLSEASCRQTKIILDTMFTWLVEAGYLDGNPLALSRTRNSGNENEKTIERYLVVEELEPIMSAISAMPANTASELRKRVRLRWILSLLFLTGLRISEAVSNTMGQFYQRFDTREGRRKWWLSVNGKGGRIVSIPVSDDLLRELTVYRETFGLPALPSSDEKIPLVFSLGPRHSSMTRQNLHRILTDAFKKIAEDMKEAGQKDEALKLAEVSAHWLRHSMGSNLIREGVDIVRVRDLMRHKNISTTNRYLHTKQDELHDEAAKHRMPGKDSDSTQ